MPGEELISQFVDLAQAEANLDAFIALVDKADERIKAVGASMAAINSASGGNTSAKFKSDTDALIGQNKALIASLQALSAEGGKRVKSQEALNSGLLEQQALTRQATADNKALAAATSELVSPYQRLTAQVFIAQTATKNLGAELLEAKKKFGENSTEVRKLQVEFDMVSKKTLSLAEDLKKLDASVGDNRRNVGNYIGAISILEKSLADVNSQMKSLEATGQQSTEAYKILNNQSQQLNVILAQQAKGFASLSREVAFNEKALETLYAAGLEGTKGYEELAQAVRQAHKDLNEMRKSQQLLETDAPALTAVTTAAKGLAGAYAVGAGVSALFADGNEKVEKELQKLIAVMTILQGLEESNAFWKLRSAILTSLVGLQEKALVGWLAIKTWVLKGTTAAQIENTVAVEAAIPALEANTAATEVQAAANEALAVSEDTAAAAGVALRIVLISLGIGAVIALIIGVIAVMKAWKAADVDVVKSLQDIAKAQKEVAEAQGEFDDMIDKSMSKMSQYLKDQLALYQAQGADQYKLLAIKQEIAAHEKIVAQGQIDALSATRTVQLQRLNDIEKYERQRVTALGLARDADEKYMDTGDEMYSRIAENFKKVADLNKDQAEAIKVDYDKGVKANADKAAAIQEQDVLSAEAAKMHADDLTKLTEATAKVRAEKVIEANEYVLNNEKSTQEQRVVALRAATAARISLIESENRAAKALDPNGHDVMDKNAAGAVAAAKTSQKEQEQKIDEDFAARRLEALYSQNKAIVEENADMQLKISEDTENSLNTRLSAYSDYVKDQKKLVNDQFDNEIAKTKLLTTEQRASLEQQRAAKLEGIDNTAAYKTPEIAKSALDTGEKSTETGNDIESLTGQLAALKALDKELAEGAITIKKYNEEKDKLSDNTAAAVLEKQTDALKMLRTAYEQYGLDTQAIDKQIVENELHMEDDKTKALEKSLEERKELQKEYAQATEELVSKTSDLIFSLMDDGVERQKNALQKQQEQQDKNYATQLQKIRDSSATEAEKAEQTIQIEAEVQATKTQNANKQKQLDIEKAKFDKAASLVKITESTAVAAIQALSYGPVTGEIFAAFIIAAGALEFAKVAAAPLPAYRDGTMSAVGGLSRVSEDGQELAIEPGGRAYLTPTKESIINVKKGTRIISAKELNSSMSSGLMVDMHGMLVPADNKTAEKIEALTHAVDHNTDATVRAIKKINVRPQVFIQDKSAWNHYLETHT